MSYGDYEAGLRARENAAAPLAEAIAAALPEVAAVDAKRAARKILDQRVVYTARAYDSRTAELEALRDVLKAFKKALLDV